MSTDADIIDRLEKIHQLLLDEAAHVRDMLNDLKTSPPSERGASVLELEDIVDGLQEIRTGLVLWTFFASQTQQEPGR